MDKRVARRLLGGLLALVLALTGCASHQGEQEPFAPPQQQRLMVYTAHKQDVYWPIIKEFEERTGIWVDVVAGGTSEMLDRIAKEGDAPVADVMFGGGVDGLAPYGQYFTPYTCDQADLILKQYRAPDDLWTPFSALPMVLVYNTKLIAPGQITAWRDLLSPNFKGKIAFADPSVSGSCFTGLVTLVCAVGGEREDVIARFAANLNGQMAKSSGDVTAAVVDGSAWVGVMLEETALKHIAAGDPIAMVYPKDGTSAVPDASALIKGGPNPDNAKLFLDFTASQDVQQLLSQFYRRPIRSDVEQAPQLTLLEDIPAVDYDMQWASQSHDGVLMTWAFYLGEGEP